METCFQALFQILLTKESNLHSKTASLKVILNFRFISECCYAKKKLFQNKKKALKLHTLPQG